MLRNDLLVPKTCENVYFVYIFEDRTNSTLHWSVGMGDVIKYYPGDEADFEFISFHVIYTSIKAKL